MTIIPALDPVRPFSAVIVPPGKKRDRHQVVWTDAWENATWFALSTEASLAYHYYPEPHQRHLMTIGSTQSYNLVGPETELLVQIDIDPRYRAQEVVMGGLILISHSPEDFTHNFFRLRHPMTRQEALEDISRALGTAEHRGLSQTGQQQLLDEISQRQGWMSLSGVLEIFSPAMERIRTHQPQSYTEREHFQWLRDPQQFATVHDLYHRGGVRTYQTDFFDSLAMGEIALRLRNAGHALSTLYFSNLFDMELSSAQVGEALTNLRIVLESLPFQDRARIQWASRMGIPEIRFDHSQRPYVHNRVYQDPLDGYAYLEMPHTLARDWLANGNRSWGLEDYFLTLHRQIQGGGLWMDGKLWIEPAFEVPDSPDVGHELFSLAYHLNNDNVTDARRTLRAFTQPHFPSDESLLPSPRDQERIASFLSQTDTLLDPVERGELRHLVSEIEGERGQPLLENYPHFDPRPRRLRELRQVSHLRIARRLDYDETLHQRSEELRSRRRRAL